VIDVIEEIDTRSAAAGAGIEALRKAVVSTTTAVEGVVRQIGAARAATGGLRAGAVVVAA
jgi:hypothetical protein